MALGTTWGISEDRTQQNEFFFLTFCRANPKTEVASTAFVGVQWNGEYIFAVLSSLKQSQAFFTTYASPTMDGLDEEIWTNIQTEIQNPDNLPEQTDQDPIIVRSMTAQTLCETIRFYELHSRESLSDGWWQLPSAGVLVFKYPSKEQGVIYSEQPLAHEQHDAMVVLQDGQGNIHLYVVYSQQQLSQAFANHDGLETRVDQYIRLLRSQSTLPVTSVVPCIYIGGPQTGSAAYCIAERLVVARRLLNQEQRRVALGI